MRNRRTRSWSTPTTTPLPRWKNIIPKVKKMATAKAAIAYLQKSPQTKGGSELDDALAKLKKLGYIKNIS